MWSQETPLNQADTEEELLDVIASKYSIFEEVRN